MAHKVQQYSAKFSWYVIESSSPPVLTATEGLIVSLTRGTYTRLYPHTADVMLNSVFSSLAILPKPSLFCKLGRTKKLKGDSLVN